jgi:hypothetical protein
VINERSALNPLLTKLSRLLEPADREYACGDLEEMRLGTPRAAANILGLIVRRQLAAWSDWKTWAALTGVSGLSGFFLSDLLGRVGTSISLQTGTYFRYGVSYEAGGVSAAQQVAYSSIALLAILFWSWGCGFVLAQLSGRAVWMNSFLFYGVVRDASMIRMAIHGNIILRHGILASAVFRLLPLTAISIVFLAAMLWGVYSARNGIRQPRSALSFLAAASVLIVLPVWMESWFAKGYATWSEQPYHPTHFAYQVLPWLACAWPVLMVPFLSIGASKNKETNNVEGFST